jgi:hypothetical protein
MPKWCDEGENRVLNILFGATAVDGTLYLGLFKNTSEPAENAVLSGLTEPSGYGYARIALTRGSWTVLADLASYAEQSFTANGGTWGDTYGYFIATSVDNSGKLLAVETFSNGPYNVTDGSNVKVTPRITCA